MTLKKKHKIILIVVVLLAIAVFITHKILRWDEPPFDDSDLAVEYLDIPDDENALTYFNRAADLLLADEKEYRAIIDQTYSIGQYDPHLSAKFIEKHAKAFELIKQGLECRHFQIPKKNTFIERIDEIEIVFPLRKIGQILSAKALHLFKQGRDKEALDTAMEIVKLGHMVQHGKGSTTTYTTTTGIKGVGLQRMREILADCKARPEILLPYVRTLECFRTSDAVLIATLKMEYRVHRSLADSMVRLRGLASPRERIIHNYRFKPNATKNQILRIYRSVIKEAQKPWSEIAAAKVNDSDDYDKLIWKIQYSPALNAIGKACVEMSIPQLKLLVKQKHHSNIAISATQLSIALKCYKLDHGDLPDSLDQLVPDHTNEIPIDDFDGKPLRYSKEKKIIYSVGPDMKDDGGPTKDEIEKNKKHTGPFWRHKDPWIRIDF